MCEQLAIAITLLHSLCSFNKNQFLLTFWLFAHLHDRLSSCFAELVRGYPTGEYGSSTGWVHFQYTGFY